MGVLEAKLGKRWFDIDPQRTRFYRAAWNADAV